MGPNRVYTTANVIEVAQPTDEPIPTLPLGAKRLLAMMQILNVLIEGVPDE